MFTVVLCSSTVSTKSSGLLATRFNEAFVVFLTASVRTLNGFPESTSSRTESFNPCVDCVQCLNCFGRLVAWSKALRRETATSELLIAAGLTIGVTAELIRLSFTSYDLVSLGEDESKRADGACCSVSLF